MAYSLEILLLVVFFIVWFFARRDLVLLAKQARPPAGDELGKVRENIEQLLDVLEEKSATAERNLRELIGEAKDAARQIEQATAMAVKSLEAAAPAPAMPSQNGAANSTAERIAQPNGAAMRPAAPAPSNGASAWPTEASASPNGTVVRHRETPAPPPAAPARTPQEPAPPAPIAQEALPEAPSAVPDRPTPPGLNPLATDGNAPQAAAAVEEIEIDTRPTSPAAIARPDSPRAPSINMMPAAESMNSMPAIEDVFTPWPATLAVEQAEDPVASRLPAEEPANAPAEESPAGEIDFQPFAITPQAVPNPIPDMAVPTQDAALGMETPNQEEASSAKRGAGSTKANRGEAASQTAAFTESAREQADEPAEQQDVAATVSTPSSDRFSEVYALAQSGVTDISEIARQTGLGRTEVEMVLSLWRRQ